MIDDVCCPYLNQDILIVAQHCIHIAVMALQSSLYFLCGIVAPLYQSVFHILWRWLVLKMVDVARLWV